MSPRTVVSVEAIGKRYRLGETFGSRTLRDTLAAGIRHFTGRSGGTGGRDRAQFWALKNVSFDVAEGEVLGIIGPNGAGKSTLLKILSKITEPTEGQIRLRGRVASLLEVGTGFHPELSGRENVFMNGAMLGMAQAEIRSKFDEIVEFSGVEQFIDTPVKRFSSGMLVRLGFAVAAHLEPEILVIDEVLAVGDEHFQRRCLRKMDEVSKSGRTVLFVSHQMAAVEALCTRALLLHGGTLAYSGPTADVVGAYRRRIAEIPNAVIDLARHAGRPSNRSSIMQRASLLNESGDFSTSFTPGDSVTIVVEHRALNREIAPVLGVVLKAGTQGPLFGVDNRVIGGFRFAKTKQAGRISCTLPELPLIPGYYTADLYFGDSLNSLDVVKDAIAFEIVQSDFYGTGRLPKGKCGPLLWRASWSWEPLAEAPSSAHEAPAAVTAR